MNTVDYAAAPERAGRCGTCRRLGTAAATTGIGAALVAFVAQLELCLSSGLPGPLACGWPVFVVTVGLAAAVATGRARTTGRRATCALVMWGAAAAAAAVCACGVLAELSVASVGGVIGAVVTVLATALWHAMITLRAHAVLTEHSVLRA